MGLRRQKVSDSLEKYVAKLLETKKPREVFEILKAEKNPLSLSEIYKIRQRRTKAGDLADIAQEFMTQLYIPPPETVRIDEFGDPGLHSFCLREDAFRVICQNLGYDISKFKVYKESSGTPTGDIQINVAVLDYGTLELFCLMEENPLFQKLLSEPAQEKFSNWKKEGGRYLTMCHDIYREIHTEAKFATFQSIWETTLSIGPQPLTPNFGDLIYQLAILHRRSPSKFPLPDRELYQIRPRNLFISELYLGLIHLASAPEPPPIPPPPFKILDTWADLHRDMIRKWSASPGIIELLALFEDLHGIEAAIKRELNGIIRGK